MKDSVSEAATAAAEVRADAQYSDLGAAAPDQTTVADALALLAAWYAVFVATEAWQKYVGDQIRRAIMNAHRVVGPVRAPLEALVARHPEIADRYPALLTYFRAGTAIATRGVQTRAINRRKKAKVVVQPTGAASTASAAATPPTPPAGAPPAANGSHGTGTG